MSDPPAPPAERLGLYELVEVIGRGGMAIVYRARQPSIDRDVAIKVIAPEFSGHPILLRRFEEEARAGARMQHPHILPVHDVGVERGQPYLVMAYLAGGTLTRRLAAARAAQGDSPGLPLPEIVCITAEIASALDYAHAQGIIHRDVKPGNVLLDAQGHAYLADFGIALLTDGDAPKEKQAPGTYAYMAPEVAAGQKASAASDIYSLGVLLFEMLAGERPFDVRSREALLAAHAEHALPDLLAKRPGLPTGVKVVVVQALSAEPECRPAHAGSLALALAHAAGMDGLPCPPLPSTLAREQPLETQKSEKMAEQLPLPPSPRALAITEELPDLPPGRPAPGPELVGPLTPPPDEQLDLPVHLRKALAQPQQVERRVDEVPTEHALPTKPRTIPSPRARVSLPPAISLLLWVLGLLALLAIIAVFLLLLGQVQITR